MAELKIHDNKGKAIGSAKLSDALATIGASHTSVHRAVVAEEANSRQGTQQTKGRSDVRGGGRKPYKQKKTGNARQGSRRAPHYAHGGMALPLTPRSYDKKINKRERRAAILSAFAAHVNAGNVTVVDSILFAEPKTKSATELLKALGLDGVRRLLVVLPAYDENTLKSFRNLPNVEVRTAPTRNAEEKAQAFSTRDVLVAHKILVAKDALDKINAVWATEAE